MQLLRSLSDLFTLSGVEGHTPTSAGERAYGPALGQAGGKGGERLTWNPSKSEFITLALPSRWYTDQVLELLMWSTHDVDVTVTCEGASQIQQMRVGTVNAAKIIVPQPIDRYEPLLQATFSLVEQLPADARIVFALSQDVNDRETCLHHDWSLNKRLAVQVATWAMVFSLVFILFGISSFYGSFVLLALPFLPGIFKMFGADFALRFNMGALAFAIYTLGHDHSGPYKSGLGVLLTVPLTISFVLAAKVFLALLAPYYFKAQLESAIESQVHNNTGNTDDIDLFCAFPERIETRALVARRIVNVKSDISALHVAYQNIFGKMPPSVFDQTCLKGWHWFNWLVDNREAAQDEARAFYASLVISSLAAEPAPQPPYSAKLAAAKKVLLDASGIPHGALSGLATAMYALTGAQRLALVTACAAGNEKTANCGLERSLCIEQYRKPLDFLLESANGWSNPAQRQHATYLEARDVAATARLSFECSELDMRNDIPVAVAHYSTLLRTIPLDARLDRSLSQINLRNLASGVLEEVPMAIAAKNWKYGDCKDYMQPGNPCGLVVKAIVGKGNRRFFSEDPIARNSDWDKPVLPLLPVKEFRDTLLAESTRNWSNPWQSLFR